MSGELQLTVALAPAGSALAPGRVFPLTDAARLGRAPDADLVLADRTVSRQHARCWPTPDGWRIENVSKANGLFVDAVPVAPGDAAAVRPGSRLQIGGIVFAVEAVAETVPVTQPLLAQAAASLVVRRDGDACTAHWAGRFVPLAPTAALVLFALARTPGAVVHEWDIQNSVGRSFNLPQAISAIRRAFRTLMQADDATRERLGALIGQAATAPISTHAPANVARQLIRARRKHGYALMLPPSAVRREEQG